MEDDTALMAGGKRLTWRASLQVSDVLLGLALEVERASERRRARGLPAGDESVQGGRQKRLLLGSPGGRQNQRAAQCYLGDRQEAREREFSETRYIYALVERLPPCILKEPIGDWSSPSTRRVERERARISGARELVDCGAQRPAGIERESERECKRVSKRAFAVYNKALPSTLYRTSGTK